MRLISLIFLSCLIAAPVAAGERSTVTFFLDGARVEREATAVNGYLEVPLASGLQAGSLRVKLLGKGTISRVDVVPAVPSRKVEKELARLIERRETLEDRLKALGVKEEIFAAAARSQSAKTPRKTKANPEPLASIRQGTDLAIARLEEVYSARRKAEHELKVVDEQLAAAKSRGGGSGNVARIHVAGKAGRVQLSYIDKDLRWIPFYDFRLAGDGKAEVAMHALLPARAKDSGYAVAVGSLADPTGSFSAVGVKDDFDVVMRVSLPVSGEQLAQLPRESLTFSFANNAGRYLPEGEAAGFFHGEYLGKTRFAGCKPDETQTLRFGVPTH